MNYTDQEIQDAVEKVVQTTIRTPYGALGNRDDSQTFSDFQTAAAGALVTNPSSAFYVVQLGTQRLVEAVTNEAATVTQLLECIENAGRRVTPIDNLAPLANARAALAALAVAASSRSTSFTSLADIPAFKRYDQSTQRFLDTASINAKSASEIVPTPQEARTQLAPLVSAVKTAHEDVIQRAQYLADAIADYDSLRLPSLLASGVLSKAMVVLSEHYDALSALSPLERLSKIRDVTLDILVGRAAVASMTAITPTTLFALIEGSALTYADVDHPATPAAITSLSGPYAVYTGHSDLNFVMDGAFSFSVPVPGAFVAFIDSTIPQPYIIVDSGSESNKHLIVGYQSTAVSGQVALDFAGGYPATRSAFQIATEFNTAASASPLHAEAIVATIQFRGVVTITNNAGPGANFTLSTGTWAALGIHVGALVVVTDPASPALNNEYITHTIIGNVLQTSGPATITEVPLRSVDVGIGRTLRIGVKPGQEATAIATRLTINFPDTSTNTALRPFYTTFPTIAFGFAAGAVISSRGADADTIAQSLPTLLATQQNGTPRLAVSSVLEPVFTGRGRSDPDDPSKLIAYVSRGRANSTAGTTVTFTLADFDVAEVAVGQILAIRETPTLADQNAHGVITAVTATQLTVTMAAPISVGTNLLIEVGPNIAPAAYHDLRVSLSISQDGDYAQDVFGQGVIPFEFTLERPVPFNRADGGQPQFFSLVVGHKCAVFASTNKTLISKIEITDPGAPSVSDEFVPGGAAVAVGTTPYIQLPSDPKTINAGDTLEIYQTQYNVVFASYAITEFESALKLITVDPPVPTNMAALHLSNNSQIPFSRIRLAKKNTYELLSSDLLIWLSKRINTPQWFTQLYAVINPLVSSANPTISQLNTAKMYVQELLGLLTVAGASQTNQSVTSTLEAILTAYSASPIDSIDTLVQTYLAKGAERGVDIFLQGRFSDFFGLTPEGLSYGGNMREQLRSVAMTDLPIRRTGRFANQAAELTQAEWQDPDYEFDYSDADNLPDIDIPGTYVEISPPGR